MWDRYNESYKQNWLGFSRLLSLFQMENQSILLRPKQVGHYNRVIDVLRTTHFIFDNSIMGSGKTIVHLLVANTYNLPVLLVCSVSAQATWEKEQKKYIVGTPVTIVDKITYQSLASRTGCQPKHGYLTRTDRILETSRGKKKQHPEFEATEKLKKLVESGVYVIFDECQSIKLKNQMHYACTAITRTILNSPSGKSRFAMLSGSPIIDHENTVNFMRLAGLITKYKLYIYHKNDASLELVGAKEFLEHCNRLNPEGTKKFLEENDLPTKNSKQGVIDFCHSLYVNVLMPRIRSAMSTPDLDSTFDVKNGYYKLSEENQTKLVDALNRLAIMLEFDEKTGEYNTKRQTLNMTREAPIIEEAKLPIFEVQAKNKLNSDSKCKVIIMVNFNASINYLEEKLKEFNPLIMTGAVKQKARKEMIDLFQQPNTDRRLLIGNIAVLAYSWNLQDTTGEYPRYIYISPNFKCDMMHQAVRRSYREGTKSSVIARIVYGASGRLETSILNAMARHTKSMKDTLPEQVSEGILFPGEYESEYEP